MTAKLPKLPEVKFNKNGYEIRSDLLGLATNFLTEEYHAKYAGWQHTMKKDPKTGELVTSVTMPEYPGLETVLTTAEKLYGFVNQSVKK